MDAPIVTEIKVEMSVRLTLTEEEAQALHNLPAYGTDVFLEMYYSRLGKTYLEPHEAGLRSLFEKARRLAVPLQRSEDVRKKLSEFEVKGVII